MGVRKSKMAGKGNTANSHVAGVDASSTSDDHGIHILEFHMPTTIFHLVTFGILAILGYLLYRWFRRSRNRAAAKTRLELQTLQGVVTENEGCKCGPQQHSN